MNKLYETNSYLKECDATVTSIKEENGEYYVTLSDTIFFPEEGGQYADTGYIEYKGEKIRVQGGIFGSEILYRVERFVPEGAKVKCELDFDVRYDRMQNHSGEHLLTGVIHNRYGYDNVGFHLSDDGPVTLDINGQLTYEQVIEMEKVANSLIYSNLPIADAYPSKEELASIVYRSKIEIAGQVRLITIGYPGEEIDICACCAPHVARTGEIGIIKVTSVVNWKGGVRISMLAGRRALEYINSEHSLVRELTQILTTNPDNIVGIIRSHIDEINLLKAKYSRVLEESILQRVDFNGLSNSDDTKATDYYEFVDEDFPQASMKNIFNILANRFEGYVGVFAGNDEVGYRYYAGSNSLDARELGNMLKNCLNAKGGGSEKMIQGQISSTKSEIERIIKEWRVE